jgi:hypothetical protein
MAARARINFETIGDSCTMQTSHDIRMKKTLV